MHFSLVPSPFFSCHLEQLINNMRSFTFRILPRFVFLTNVLDWSMTGEAFVAGPTEQGLEAGTKVHMQCRGSKFKQMSIQYVDWLYQAAN